MTFLHETEADYVEKTTPRARQKTSAGQIWPTVRTLPTPDLT